MRRNGKRHSWWQWIFVGCVAMAVMVAPAAAQDAVKVPGEPPKQLANCFPPSTVLFVESPDLARTTALLMPPVPEGDREAAFRRADVDEYRKRMMVAIGHAFGLNDAEIEKFTNGTKAVAFGLLDAGRDFGHAMVAVRHAHIAEMVAALARLSREAPSRATQAEVAGHPMFTVTMPKDIDELADQLPQQNDPFGESQNPYQMLLRFTGEQLEVTAHGDVLLIANDATSLHAVANMFAGEGAKATFADSPTYKNHVADAEKHADTFLVVDMLNVLDLLERVLDERERQNLDDASGRWAHLPKIIGLVARANLKAQGATVLGRLFFNNHPTFNQLKMAPRPLNILNSVPENAVGGVAIAVPNPSDAVARVLDFIRIVVPDDARDSFEEELTKLENELGVPLTDLVAPLDEEAAMVVVDPRTLPQPEPSDDPNEWTPSPQGIAYILTVKDSETFDDMWGRFAESPRLSDSMGLSEGNVKDIEGVQAFVSGRQWGGVCWARVGKFFIVSPDEASLTVFIRAAKLEPGAAGTLGHNPAFKELRARFPEQLSKFGFLDFGTTMSINSGSMGSEIPIADLAQDVWLGLALVEGDTLEIHFEARVPQFPARLEAAIYAGIEQTRISACQANLQALGNAIRDYQLDRGEYPGSIDDLVAANKFSLGRHGASPIEVAQARREGKSADEIAAIRSYEIIKPAVPGGAMPEVDSPWDPPIHSFMLAHTQRAVYGGGRHVLMSNGTVHWVSEEHFQALKRQAEQGLTQADLDELWNRQARQRQNQPDANGPDDKDDD